MSKDPEKDLKISTESYKGVRDFYPPDMFVQNYIFKTMRKVSESYGYLEYHASILEPSDLYKAKSGQEIVNDQTYNFTDRGGRDVTLRPEMTPTVARMVARNKKELSLPLRWYSIPNLFRYENPQKGRLREHWQLNVDIFGVKSISADTEIISIAKKIMNEFGARDDQFEIQINHRKILESIYKHLNLSSDESYAASKILDKKKKISGEDFRSKLEEVLGEKTDEFIAILDSKNIDDFENKLPKEISREYIEEIRTLFKNLKELGITNFIFSPTMVRGFDYYTGIIFEVFDTGEENRRSLFGGGRYDDLLDIFGSEKITAVGFGMGDVTIRDFLETYSLIPEYKNSTDLYVCIIGQENEVEALKLADYLRKFNLKISIDLSHRKVGDQIKTASKQAIKHIICVGSNEIKTNVFRLKNIITGEEKDLNPKDLADFLNSDIK